MSGRIIITVGVVIGLLHCRLVGVLCNKIPCTTPLVPTPLGNIYVAVFIEFVNFFFVVNCK